MKNWYLIILIFGTRLFGQEYPSPIYEVMQKCADGKIYSDFKKNYDFKPNVSDGVTYGFTESGFLFLFASDFSPYPNTKNYSFERVFYIDIQGNLREQASIVKLERERVYSFKAADGQKCFYHLQQFPKSYLEARTAAGFVPKVKNVISELERYGAKDALKLSKFKSWREVFGLRDYGNLLIGKIIRHTDLNQEPKRGAKSLDDLWPPNEVQIIEKLPTKVKLRLTEERKFVEKEGYWYKVVYNDKEGYVFSYYLEEIGKK